MRRSTSSLSLSIVVYSTGYSGRSDVGGGGNVPYDRMVRGYHEVCQKRQHVPDPWKMKV